MTATLGRGRCTEHATAQTLRGAALSLSGADSHDGASSTRICDGAAPPKEERREDGDWMSCHLNSILMPHWAAAVASYQEHEISAGSHCGVRVSDPGSLLDGVPKNEGPIIISKALLLRPSPESLQRLGRHLGEHLDGAAQCEKMSAQSAAFACHRLPCNPRRNEGRSPAMVLTLRQFAATWSHLVRRSR